MNDLKGKTLMMIRRRYFGILCLLLLMLISEGCSKEKISDNGSDQSEPPAELTLPEIDKIASRFARVSWSIYEDEWNTMTETGICYGLSPAPTINDYKIVGGNALGGFQIRLSGLEINTKYYLRIYVKTNKGLFYGSIVNFTTLGVAQLEAVTIGSQIWSKQNLNIEVFKNGDDIPIVTQWNYWAVLNSPGACYWQNTLTYRNKYGLLYNWYAVNDPRGLAPEGWHIPTESEWNTLIEYLGGPSVAGGKLKAAGLDHWLSPNKGATNTSGFSALPGSSRGDDAVATYPYSIGYIGIWWSSNQVNQEASAYYLSNESAAISKTESFFQAGYSIRCIKD